MDNNIIWSSASGSGSIGGIVERFDLRNGQARNVEVWPDQVNGTPAADLRYRFVWTFPLTISPHDHNKLYVGSQHVHQTRRRQQLAGNQSRSDFNDKSRRVLRWTHGGNIGVGIANAAWIANHLRAGLICRYDDGIVAITRYGGTTGRTSQRHSEQRRGAGQQHRARDIRRHRDITVDGHQVTSRSVIYKTTDYGKREIDYQRILAIFSAMRLRREIPCARVCYMSHGRRANVSHDAVRNGSRYKPYAARAV